MPLKFHSTKKIEESHGDGVWALSWCNGGLVTGSSEGVLKYWDAHGNLSFASSKAKLGITSIASLQDGSMAIACYQDSIIRFFDLVNGELMPDTINTELLEAYSISLSPGEDILVSGSGNGSIAIWSMDSEHAKIGPIKLDMKGILKTTFSIDGKLAVSAVDGKIGLCDLEKQQLAQQFDAHAMPVRALSFSPDGNLLFSGSDDRQINIFDTRSGQQLGTFSNEGSIYSIDASPDGRHFITGSADSKVSLYDLGMQKRIQKLENHQDAVWAVGFDKSNSNGHRFASGSDDSTIHIYDVTK